MCNRDYYDEWMNHPDEEYDLFYEDYAETRVIEDYGEDCSFDDDDDSNDKF